MKIILLFFGLCSLFLGLIGVVLPLLPTTPFLLLALYLFTKSSKRIEEWFLHSKIYNKYLSDFHQNHRMKLRNKITILLFSDTMIIISFILTDSTPVRIMLIFLEVFKYWYFVTKVKTSEDYYT